MKPATQIEDLTEGAWVVLEVTVRQVWENEHPSIRQVGLLSDETGIVKFVAWEKSDLPLMEEGATYRIGKCPVSSYDDNLQVALVSTTTITRIDMPEQQEIPTV